MVPTKALIVVPVLEKLGFVPSGSHCTDTLSLVRLTLKPSIEPSDIPEIPLLEERGSY